MAEAGAQGRPHRRGENAPHHGPTEGQEPSAECPPSVYAQPEVGLVNTIRAKSQGQVKELANMEFREVRCGKCEKLLAKVVVGIIEIKCPRCGSYNILKVKNFDQESREPLGRNHLGNAKEGLPSSNFNRIPAPEVGNT